MVDDRRWTVDDRGEHGHLALDRMRRTGRKLSDYSGVMLARALHSTIPFGSTVDRLNRIIPG